LNTVRLDVVDKDEGTFAAEEVEGWSASFFLMAWKHHAIIMLMYSGV
jgi:hypothetical protein